jgi:RNA polymerase sigma-70 factor (ECF subfamily)
MEDRRHFQAWGACSKAAIAGAREAELADQAALLERLRKRDPQSMSDLYDRYGGLVYSQIFRLIRSRGAAEDLLQETFLRIWNRIHTYDASRGGLGLWIATVARHLAIDYVRSAAGRAAEKSLSLEEIERTAGDGDFQLEVLQLDRVRELNRAFKLLNMNQRLVLRLAFRDGMSHSEIAFHLKRPLGTVKSWARTAMIELRRQLQGSVADVEFS